MAQAGTAKQAGDESKVGGDSRRLVREPVPGFGNEEWRLEGRPSGVHGSALWVHEADLDRDRWDLAELHWSGDIAALDKHVLGADHPGVRNLVLIVEIHDVFVDQLFPGMNQVIARPQRANAKYPWSSVVVVRDSPLFMLSR